MPVRFACQPYSFEAARLIVRELGVSPVLASILVRRGHDTPEGARRFLAAADRHSPWDFEGMRDACELVLRHVERGGRIVVHGDYDVDGVASTAIVLRALRALGADPGWHLPSRFDEGYGLAASTVERLASEGASLLITTDCGITAAEQVDVALAAGLDVLVTDHHRPAERLPACPIVHPVVCGYPCPDLAAAGVAHKLAEALYESAGRDPRLADGDLDLVALATIADLVPLRGENRRLAREGLRELARTRKPGLRALMRVSGVEPGSAGAQAVGYRLAPRINAAGRLQRADAGLELLLTEDEARAEAVAEELDLLNRERRDEETRILFAAEAARAEQDAAAAYVLAGEGWNPGVIGIVASRMVERHHRPCLMVALGPEGGRGSGRSVLGFDLHAGLAAASGHLRRFGGHRAAAGFELDPERLDGFRRAFAEHAASVLSPHDLAPVERVDAVVPGGSVGLELAEELARLEPRGMGNPGPVLLLPGSRVDGVRPMGEEGQHSCFDVASGGSRARVVAFRTPPRAIERTSAARQDVAARLELNEWNGSVEPRLVLRAMRPVSAADCELLGEDGAFWDELEAALARAPGADAAPAGEGAGREVVDRRAEGIAGLLGDLLSSSGDVLVVCADTPRRRRALGGLVGGLRASLRDHPAPPLALVSWPALRRRPELARRFAHLVAIDPPTVRGGIELAATAGPGFLHLVWGRPEVEFARAVARARLELRPALTELFRGLRERGGEARGEELERLLRGADGRAGPHEAAALVAVLGDLGLASYRAAAEGGPACTLAQGRRARLEDSARYAAGLAELRQVERELDSALESGGGRRPAVAAGGR